MLLLFMSNYWDILFLFIYLFAFRHAVFEMLLTKIQVGSSTMRNISWLWSDTSAQHTFEIMLPGNHEKWQNSPTNRFTVRLNRKHLMVIMLHFMKNIYKKIISIILFSLTPILLMAIYINTVHNIQPLYQPSGELV